ncbi:histidinol-phosphate aminotransferase [Idiomarina sp. A28L]|uniref:histidinol-phosphate transaminase n=1 Tax=Idiomarina sp. A28L TaxID=1036674 RepID=UPI0002138CE9|nr:histidinol-phosphate transaminase [Idiomarina sp. A28L]EGN74417.1 histidinol-phosphate aminotransferase [Idiomarina sp. A28L]
MSAGFIQQLLREHLQSFTPYASARRSMSGGNLWLNANESPYGRSYQVATEDLNRYPDFQNKKLNQAYANYAGVNANQLISHRGSDESIELLIRSFCEPGRDQILICPPTYGMYAISASINHNETVVVPLQQQNWQLDLDGIQKALDEAAGRIKVVFLCNPSNPLGNALREEDILAVIEMCRGRALVVSDEAYIEFAETSKFVEALAGLSASEQEKSKIAKATNNVSMVRYLETYENLVVMRTLSKAFGLAGIRVGFTIGSEALINALLPILAPYPLPDVSVQIASQALQFDNLIATRQNTFETVSERDLLAIELQKLSYVTAVYPSVTNFILIQVQDAQALIQYCVDAGVLLRNQSNQIGLEQVVRITIGSPEENIQLLSLLKKYQQLNSRNDSEPEKTVLTKKTEAK